MVRDIALGFTIVIGFLCVVLILALLMPDHSSDEPDGLYRDGRE